MKRKAKTGFKEGRTFAEGASRIEEDDDESRASGIDEDSDDDDAESVALRQDDARDEVADNYQVDDDARDGHSEHLRTTVSSDHIDGNREEYDLLDLVLRVGLVDDLGLLEAPDDGQAVEQDAHTNQDIHQNQYGLSRRQHRL